MSNDVFLILLSHDKILAFLLSVIVRNSSLLAGVLICLFKKSLLLWFLDLNGHVYLPCVKIKRNGTHVFLQNRFTDKLIFAVGNEFAAGF